MDDDLRAARIGSGLLASGEHRQAYRWRNRIHHLRARPLEWRRLAALVERITTPDSNASLHLTGDGAGTDIVRRVPFDEIGCR